MFRRSLSAVNELQRRGVSWSGYERNCFFLNTGTGRFANAAAVSGFDFLDDARAVAIVDWNADGAQDLWVTNRTGPRVRVLQNQPHPHHHWIKFRLTGTACNRDAIGARLELRATGQKPLVATVRAGAGYLSQSSKWIHFGLGPHTGPVDLVVHWPGSNPATYHGLRTDAAYQITQGVAEPASRDRNRTTTSGTFMAESHLTEPSQTPRAKTGVAMASAQTFLPLPVPLPQLTFALDSGEQAIVNAPGKPAVLTLWSLQCPPCLAELSGWTRDSDTLSPTLELVALNVDGLNSSDGKASSAARRWLREIGFPYRAGDASTELLRKLELAQLHLFDTQQPLPLPLTLLFDQQGALAAWYRGTVSTPRLMDDIHRLSAAPAEKLRYAVPFPGRWRTTVHRTNVAAVVNMFRQTGDARDELEIYGCALRASPADADLRVAIADALVRNGRHPEALDHLRRATELAPDVASTWTRLGKLVSNTAPTEAQQYFERALLRDPEHAEAHLHLGRLLLGRGDAWRARDHLQQAAKMRPHDLVTIINLALAHERTGHAAEARTLLERAIDIDPQSVYARNNLAWLLATTPDATVRDPQRALEIASAIAAATAYEDPLLLDTLAAALASNSQFERAVLMLEDSLRKNPHADKSAMARRLERYRAGKTDWESD